ncbi:MAG: vitamin K epoxide reductase family protein [Vicinamibacterales bacterium]
MSAIAILTWLSLIVGAAASIAALWGYYGELPSWLTGPEVCAMEGGGCAILFRTSRAALLGVPNASLGVLLYLLLAFALRSEWPAWMLIVMVLPAVAMSTFLGWSLLSRGLQCRICWAGHAANFALLCAVVLRAT